MVWLRIDNCFPALPDSRLGKQFNVTMLGATLGQNIKQTDELAGLHHLCGVLRGTKSAVEIPEIGAFGQIAPALAFHVLADVVLDGIEHTVRVLAFGAKRVGFSHGKSG
jgi:hypothetical protein